MEEGNSIGPKEIEYLMIGLVAYDCDNPDKWIEENGGRINPQFMASVYSDPHKFFCQETGQDPVRVSELVMGVKRGLQSAIAAFSSGEELEFENVEVK